jgi:hypothetical protein
LHLITGTWVYSPGSGIAIYIPARVVTLSWIGWNGKTMGYNGWSGISETRLVVIVTIATLINFFQHKKMGRNQVLHMDLCGSGVSRDVWDS